MKYKKSKSYEDFVGDGLLYFITRLWCYKNKVPYKEAKRINKYFTTNNFFGHCAYELNIENARDLDIHFNQQADIFEKYVFNIFETKGLVAVYVWYEENVVPLIKKQTVIEFNK